MHTMKETNTVGSAIDFTPERWARVKDNARRWWNGELGRPLIHLTCAGHDPGRPEPALPSRMFTASYGLSVTAEAVVDRWDYDLSRQLYLGDAFPCVWPNFGPGVVAAFLGAELHCDASTVWFHPPTVEDIQTLSFAHRFDPDNVWFRRVQDVYREAGRRWQGLVQLSMTDLGGAVDIVSTFRPGEGLLMDLYDQPHAVKRCTWEVFSLWWRYFDEIWKTLAPVNPGYTAWTPVFSETPYYMLQCDFCYMIGPDMFDEFVKPELAASCSRLSHAFYHLDGVGQIPHLDSLLAIPELKGVQWVPGAGKPTCEEWIDLYRKIHKAGKKIQIWTSQSGPGYKVLDILEKELGTAEGVVLIGSVAPEELDEARRFLERYGADTA